MKIRYSLIAAGIVALSAVGTATAQEKTPPTSWLSSRKKAATRLK